MKSHLALLLVLSFTSVARGGSPPMMPTALPGASPLPIVAMPVAPPIYIAPLPTAGPIYVAPLPVATTAPPFAPDLTCVTTCDEATTTAPGDGIPDAQAFFNALTTALSAYTGDLLDFLGQLTPEAQRLRLAEHVGARIALTNDVRERAVPAAQVQNQLRRSRDAIPAQLATLREIRRRVVLIALAGPDPRVAQWRDRINDLHRRFRQTEALATRLISDIEQASSFIGRASIGAALVQYQMAQATLEMPGPLTPQQWAATIDTIDRADQLMGGLFDSLARIWGYGAQLLLPEPFEGANPNIDVANLSEEVRLLAGQVPGPAAP